MQNEIKVTLGSFSGEKKYVAIVSRHANKWVFVRAAERQTLEIPAGNIEKGEDVFTAAKRELFEETGAKKYTLDIICEFEVNMGGKRETGALFYANISELGALPESEIAEMLLLDTPPEIARQTFPHIQPVLFDFAKNWIEKQTLLVELWDIYDQNRVKTGRTHLRGAPLASGERHLVVHVWIKHPDGRFLITKRAANKSFPLMWETVGGSAVTGDDSAAAALREVFEETGLRLDPKKGRCVRTLVRFDDIADIWLFEHDVDLSKIKLLEGETVEARLAAPGEIRQMTAAGDFFKYSYLEDILKI